MERNRDRDEDRGSRRRDDDDRGSRRRSDDDEPRSRRREEDEPRSRRREEDEPRSRSREDDSGSRRRDDDDRGSRRRDDDGGSRRGGGRFEYQARTEEQRSKRASMGASDFDKMLKPHIKMWKPNDGDNRIRILPPTWKGAEHYGYDVYVHYGVGADRGSYLCLAKMKNEPDPIAEAHERAREDGDEEYAKELSPKRRVLIYLIDRDHPKEGVQAWAMPWTLDRDITTISKDKSTGEVFQVDHPEDGFDVEFTKKGQKARTEYTAAAIARRSSPLGKEEWLDFAVDNPLPEQLVFFDYEHIKKAFGGGSTRRDDDRGDDRRSRDRDDDRRSKDRDDDRGERRNSSREEPERRGRSRDPEEPTWESVHEMTATELDDLIEQEKLDIDPKEAKDDEDLADWICDELKLKKTERRRVSDDDAPRDRLSDMRRRRED